MARIGGVIVGLVLSAAIAFGGVIVYLILTNSSPPVPTHEILPLMRWLSWL